MFLRPLFSKFLNKKSYCVFEKDGALPCLFFVSFRLSLQHKLVYMEFVYTSVRLLQRSPEGVPVA